MNQEILHLAAVTGGLVLLVVLPFVPVVRFLSVRERWSSIFLNALILGCSLQSVVGMIWTHVVGKAPYGELSLYAFIWGSLFLGSWQLHKKRASNYEFLQPRDENGYFPLIIVLCAAFLVRSIHPIQVAYLGQSDAYTHLNYLHNIVDKAYLINPVYPPGYHWILALPVLVFSIDPYLVARYGGAFFGVGLVLAVYVLLERFFNRRTALFGSFCCACFPFMNLLMKTGVGAFANQLGLLLIPAILFYHSQVVTIRSQQANRMFFLILALCGMVAAVPMMILHLLIIMMLERIIMLLRAPKTWLAGSLRTFIIVILAVFLLVFHLSQVGAGHRFQTANIMIGEGEKKQQVTERVITKVQSAAASFTSPTRQKITALVTESPYFHLLVDYVSIKRVNGFGNTYLNYLGWLLAALFLLFTLYGALKKLTGFLIIGIWGILTTVQAGVGFLQFSSYQREGWSLLIAVCCMSGILAGYIFRYGSKSNLFKMSVALVMAVSFLWTLKRPPVHLAIRSGAEDQLVRAVRFFGQDDFEKVNYCMQNDDELCAVSGSLVSDVPLTLLSRRFTGWGNQGEITPNVLQRESLTQYSVVGANNRERQLFKPGRQYVALVDKQGKLSGSNIISAFAMVTPGMVKQTMRNRDILYRANETLLEYIKDLSANEWRIHEFYLSDRLKAVLIVPASMLK